MNWHPNHYHAFLRHNEWSGFSYDLAPPLPEESKEIPLQYLENAYSELILPEYQPKIVGAYVRIKGNGVVKLEIKTLDGRSKQIPLRWVRILLEPTPDYQNLVWIWQKPGEKAKVFQVEDIKQLDTLNCETESQCKAVEQIREAITFVYRQPHVKELGWVVESPDTNVYMDEIGLIFAMPRFEETNEGSAKRFFLKSLAKLARCYDPASGLVKDKAHIPPGDQDNIPTSGMFCLALAAGWDAGFVTHKDAVGVLCHVHQVVKHEIPKARGWLPHFVKRKGRRYIVEKDGEFSTIDTALYYHGMLLAAEILEQEDLVQELHEQIKAIDFEFVTVRQADSIITGTATKEFLSKKIHPDGRPALADDMLWKDWGGEWAILMCFWNMHQQLRCKDPPNVGWKSSSEHDAEGTPGRFFEGRGFIAEIQSLFYPHFNTKKDDDLTNTNWLQSRQKLLQKQICVTRKYFCDTAAGCFDLFGYSVGDHPFEDDGYLENGTRPRKKLSNGQYEYTTPQPILFPHYMMMAACILPDKKDTKSGLSTAELIKKFIILEQEELFTPYGLVESFDVCMNWSHGFIGSLNAAFEVIAAYHLLRRSGNGPLVRDLYYEEDIIYGNSDSVPLLRSAPKVIYPRMRHR